MNDILYMRYRALIKQVLIQYLYSRGDLFVNGCVDASGYTKAMEKALMELRSALVAQARGITVEMQDTLMHLIGEAALVIDGEQQLPEDVMLKVIAEHVSVAGGEVQIVEDVLMLMAAMLRSVASGIPTDAENGYCDATVEVVVNGIATPVRVRDVLMESIDKMYGYASGVSYGLVYSSGATLTNVLSVAGLRAAPLDKTSGIVDAICFCIAGAFAAEITYGCGDTAIKVITESCAKLQECADVGMHACVEMLGTAGAESIEFESILLALLVETLTTAGAHSQEVLNALACIASSIKCVASGQQVSPEDIRLHSSPEMCSSASAFTLGLPYQYGNILKIPSAYSATPNGNVLKVT